MTSKRTKFYATIPPSQQERVRINLDIPKALLEQLFAATEKGAAKNRNALIITAIESYLKILENLWIDQEFAEMTSDERYRALNLKVAEEFKTSDWEAIRIRDKS